MNDVNKKIGKLVKQTDKHMEVFTKAIIGLQETNSELCEYREELLQEISEKTKAVDEIAYAIGENERTLESLQNIIYGGDE